MKKLMICLPLLIMLAPLFAGWDLPKPNFSPYQSNNSLLSMDKLTMSHSMGFAAGSSSDGTGYYLSRYTNHMLYKFNPKLEMGVDLNFVNFGGMNTSSKLSFEDNNTSRVIPDFMLNYKPADNLLFQFRMTYGTSFGMNELTDHHSNW